MAKMSINMFTKTAKLMPANISILMRGETGIGKSQLVRQLAVHWGFKPEDVIDRRLAQMSEGDMVGLPSTDGNVTRFNPPDWYKKACNAPCVLFLDELNRAAPEVMQAAFQVVLDRELNGWQLHPGTRVLSAVNVGSNYVVNEMDPALLRRFWAVDLDPTKNDWLKWARDVKKMNEVIVEFIQQDDSWLRAPQGANLDDVHPTPASWERLNDSLIAAGVIDTPEDPVFRMMCLGFIGIEATSKFVEFAKMSDANVTGVDILEKYSKIRARLKKNLSKEKWAAGVESLAVACRNLETAPTSEQVKNVKEFIEDCPVELRVAFIPKLTETAMTDSTPADKKDRLMKNLKVFWNAISESTLEAYGIEVPTQAKVNIDSAVAVPPQAPKKRGRPKKTP